MQNTEPNKTFSWSWRKSALWCLLALKIRKKNYSIREIRNIHQTQSIRSRQYSSLVRSFDTFWLLFSLQNKIIVSIAIASHIFCVCIYHFRCGCADILIEHFLLLKLVNWFVSVVTQIVRTEFISATFIQLMTIFGTQINMFGCQQSDKREKTNPTHVSFGSTNNKIKKKKNEKHYSEYT